MMMRISNLLAFLHVQDQDKTETRDSWVYDTAETTKMANLTSISTGKPKLLSTQILELS